MTGLLSGAVGSKVMDRVFTTLPQPSNDPLGQHLASLQWLINFRPGGRWILAATGVLQEDSTQLLDDSSMSLIGEISIV